MREVTLNTILTNNEFYALLALTDKTLHGYGVRDQIAYDSASSLVLAPGVVYALLRRLQGKGLIERVEAWDRSDIACRYRLTEFGRRRLQAEVERLERVIAHTHYKLGRKLY